MNPGTLSGRQGHSAGRRQGLHGVRLLVYTDARCCAGSEASLATLLAHLAPEVDVTVVGIDPGVVDWIASRREGVRRQVLRPVTKKRDVRGMLEHQVAVWRLRPHILHANLNAPMSSRAAITAGLGTPGVRVVSVEHTLLPVSNERERRRKARLSRAVHAQVAVGERLARCLEETYSQPPGSIRTIYTGVPELGFDPVALPLRGPVIGYLGRLSEEKGADVLLRALALLPEANVVLVGDGPERGRLEALAHELRVSDRVLLHGWREDARRLLPSFDVLALPSRSEGFGLAIVEAMLAAVPVVASRVGSVPDTVVEGETGLLVPPGDPSALAAALRQVLADPDLGAHMGKRGRAVALERFSPPRMARAFEALYKELLD